MTYYSINDRRERSLSGSHIRRGPFEAAFRLVAGAGFATGLAMTLGGCASGPSSSMFVDPAAYDLYNCQQLGTARRTANNRVTELEGLMAKAETAAGGALMSGLAYQTDYLSERARRDQIDEKIAANNCTPADLAAPAHTPAAQPAPPVRRRR